MILVTSLVKGKHEGHEAHEDTKNTTSRYSLESPTRSTGRRAQRAAAEGGSCSNETGRNKPHLIPSGLFLPVSLLHEAPSNAQAFVTSVSSWPVRDKRSLKNHENH
jgi:hypothetical protein